MASQEKAIQQQNEYNNTPKVVPIFIFLDYQRFNEGDSYNHFSSIDRESEENEFILPFVVTIRGNKKINMSDVFHKDAKVAWEGMFPTNLCISTLKRVANQVYDKYMPLWVEHARKSSNQEPIISPLEYYYHNFNSNGNKELPTFAAIDFGVFLEKIKNTYINHNY